MPRSGHLALLLRLEATRLGDAFRHPRAGTWAGVLLPAALVVGGLWLAGESWRPDVREGNGRFGLGLLAAAPVALQAYTLLFRPGDDGFLRRLGIPARSIFGLRALRLLAVALATALALMIPRVATGGGVGAPLAVALASALVAWAVSCWKFAGAAELTVKPGHRPGLLSKSMGFDPDLVKAGPLVFAPVLPAVAGGVAALLAGIDFGATLPVRAAILIALSFLLLPSAAKRFERAIPRFGPHAGELAYAPPPEAGDSHLVIGRGLARVLPRRAGAVRARDAVVVDRRFRWAGRAVAPLAVFAVLALIRAGDDAAVRGWVTLACGALLAAQGMAVVALGRSERGRARWLDRASGLTLADRLLGRWAAAFGLSLGLVIPLSVGWAVSVSTSPGWWWIAGAAAGAALASAASVAAAGR
ncbi:MAG TPA: hypothetical protein VFR81_16740 [Longimicrobium sp.]|nr:hypothetical protein [Longimicrobium sp.]